MIFTEQELVERFHIILTQLGSWAALKNCSCLYPYTLSLGRVVCWYSRLEWKGVYWCSRFLGRKRKMICWYSRLEK